MIHDYKFRSAPVRERRTFRVHGLVFYASVLSLGTIIVLSLFGTQLHSQTNDDLAFKGKPDTALIALDLPRVGSAGNPETAVRVAKLPQQSPPSLADESSETATIPALVVAKTDTSKGTTPTRQETTNSIDEQGNSITRDLDEKPSATDVNFTSDKWLRHEVTAGDTLGKIFSAMNLSARLLHDILHADEQTQKLHRIRPGQRFSVKVDPENLFQELIYQISPTKSLRILPLENGFKTQLIERPVETRTAHAAGIITNSLFESAQHAGLSDAKTMELANIFGWDIDFALEIRAGDQFSVIYAEDYLDGEKLRDGPILAAEFINKGMTYRAVRYVDTNGLADYYTLDGKSVRKAFLRMPVKFARISSRFSLGRKHPILNGIRAHRGVDYAAPRGTPIRASGDGRISFRGKKGGYGKTVIIEHGGAITTLYGHLSKFASSARQGSKIRQGQVIGYVGSSGLATGPHLHYEFRLNGVNRNPLTVRLPPADPIDKRSRPNFQNQTQPLIAQLDALSSTLVATTR